LVVIKVVGPGCANCNKLAEMCKEIVSDNEIEATISKITNIHLFANLEIFMTPGLIINGKVKASGKLPTHSTLTHWIKDATVG
jgi:small redox-active disulfide protein 2